MITSLKFFKENFVRHSHFFQASYIIFVF